MFKTNKFFSLLLAIGMVCSFVVPVIADGNDTGAIDLSNFYGPDGKLLEGVTDGGEVEVDADWMNSGGGNGMEVTSPPATYHVYIAPNGDTLIAPSLTTTIAMIENPEVSGILGADGSYQTGLATLLTEFLRGQEEYGPGALIVDGNGNLVPTTYTDEHEQQLLNLLLENLQSANLGNYSEGLSGFNNSLMFTWNYLVNLFVTGVDDGMIAGTYLYYSAANCAKSPVGCTPEQIAILAALAESENPPPVVPPSCPASTIVPGTPSLSISKTGPNNPLVVGQDPDRRGADVSFSVVVPPTVYTYYVPIPIYEDVQLCVGNEDGTSVVGGNCTSGSVKGTLINTRQLVRVDCEKHVEVYAEPIGAVNATADLNSESVNWINHELSAYYYGAHTIQTSFGLVPGLGSANVYCDGGKTCYANGAVSNIPFADPGTFSLNLYAATNGTPVSTGRTFRASGDLQVSFIAVRLIENGSH